MGLLSWSSRSPPSKPWGLKWRSSVWFATVVVGFGITTDLLVYSIIIPVLPFQLEHLGYHQVSALTGWLLCAYSGGLVISTIPIAIYSEHYSARRIPLIIGLITLLGAQVMLMEAPSYWVMCLARIVQGISSSMVWIVGLALLCETTPERFIGRQLGIAIMGLSVGLLVGSPAGGILYSRWGFRAPFIFGEICTAVDLIGRLLIIERKEAMVWGVDPAADPLPNEEDPHGPQLRDATQETSPSQPSDFDSDVDGLSPKTPSEVELNTTGQVRPSIPASGHKPLPMLTVIARLSQSPRALAALGMALVYGIVNSSQEPSLPLHLQAIWGFDSYKVGLVYLAAVVPALVSSPLAGYYTDRKGSHYLTCLCLLLALPWWVVLTLRRSLVLFIFALALQSFFVAGVVPPVTAELAAVSRSIPGVGYAHVYGAFNLAFGIGTAVGPIIGGQIYDKAKHGWTAVCSVTAALIVLCVMLAFCYTGADPLLNRFMRQYYPAGPHELAQQGRRKPDPSSEDVAHDDSDNHD
ncbi:hypothetical protein SERLA73DRAFT_176125 [Serpula lacrymans var. lacrymans S7.3]|uniref:Major facilitator superfamily (MFS) profile domain-containing protein n=2 Tax=Serpula lacrymans var. lacrymans TaxID=341189 RepID=F8PMD1_SERL3|nr:uncharacterized protein SERLADRAFT_458884 [Serpula lacrymans var. lacrymans S7.9]EGO02763.1 hypothetical protein SERLA73DRAFT_176125 [Serpula lacrymans var. lacrymans S7.3]EGO28463.1 hypothetical protein SERLADRAFT_458884 [Serpula lacrymans var. lacrymans S7.9]